MKELPFASNEAVLTSAARHTCTMESLSWAALSLSLWSGSPTHLLLAVGEPDYSLSLLTKLGKKMDHRVSEPVLQDKGVFGPSTIQKPGVNLLNKVTRNLNQK